MKLMLDDLIKSIEIFQTIHVKTNDVQAKLMRFSQNFEVVRGFSCQGFVI